jgi:biopolymer transport protein ExbB/TolQ
MKGLLKPLRETEEGSTRTSVILLVGLTVIIRVVVAIVVWLVLFLGVFLGYFTVPVFAVGALILLSAALDVGLFARVRDIERDREERQAFLRDQREKQAEEFEQLDRLIQ